MNHFVFMINKLQNVIDKWGDKTIRLLQFFSFSLKSNNTPQSPLYYRLFKSLTLRSYGISLIGLLQLWTNYVTLDRWF